MGVHLLKCSKLNKTVSHLSAHVVNRLLRAKRKSIPKILIVKKRLVSVAEQVGLFLTWSQTSGLCKPLMSFSRRVVQMGKK